MTLTPQEAQPLKSAPSCAHCGMWHVGMCRKVKIIKHYPDGSVAEVHYRRWWSRRGYLTVDDVMGAAIIGEA